MQLEIHVADPHARQLLADAGLGWALLISLLLLATLAMAWTWHAGKRKRYDSSSPGAGSHGGQPGACICPGAP